MVFVQKHLKIFVSKFWKFFEEFLYTFQKIKTPVFSLVHSKKYKLCTSQTVIFVHTFSKFFGPKS